MTSGKFICIEEANEEFESYVLVGYSHPKRAPIGMIPRAPYKFIKVKKNVRYIELLLKILDSLSLMNELELIDNLSEDDWNLILSCLTMKKAIKKLKQILKKKKIIAKIEEANL